MAKLSEILAHPEEWPALFLLYMRMRRTKQLLTQTASPQWQFSYEMLTRTSRSFALVIQELQGDLRDAICIFYLVLRGLDTIEDDPGFPMDKKVPLLHTFSEVIEQRGWTLTDCGENDNELTLMSNFDQIITCYLGLKPIYRNVIKDITKRMGDGMADFLTKTVVTVKDWDLYCHYVAGLVGIGLSNLFAASQLEDQSFRTADKLSNSMGLFLQKTNIIRDYREDIFSCRMFWPDDIWKKYTDKLENFADPHYRREAVHCLNDLVTNALQHIPECLEYMSRLRNPKDFTFCAIPQVMAAATLSLCFNNPEVFEGVVKMRRGETALVFLNVVDISSVYYYFDHYVQVIENKIDPSDPNAERTRQICSHVRQITGEYLAVRPFYPQHLIGPNSSLIPVVEHSRVSDVQLFGVVLGVVAIASALWLGPLWK